jgi:hypothetical protein
MNYLGFIFIFAGLFSAAGALFEWPWFMEHRRARFFVRILGYTGARMFYLLLGVGLGIFGVIYTFNAP